MREQAVERRPETGSATIKPTPFSRSGRWAELRVREGGGKRKTGSAGQRTECGPEGVGEVRRRAGDGSFRHDPG